MWMDKPLSNTKKPWLLAYSTFVIIKYFSVLKIVKILIKSESYFWDPKIWIEINEITRSLVDFAASQISKLLHEMILCLVRTVFFMLTFKHISEIFQTFVVVVFGSLWKANFILLGVKLSGNRVSRFVILTNLSEARTK